MSDVVRGHYRAGSRRGEGLRVKWDAHQVGRWLFRVGQAVPAGSSPWKVATALAAVIGEDGRLDPTKRWIGTMVGKCERTAARALKQLATLGFVTWHRRITVTDGIEHQTSNAYQLAFPDTEPSAPAAPEQSFTSPSIAVSVYKEDSKSTDQVLSDISPPPAAPIARPGGVLTAIRQLPVRVVRAAQRALDDRARKIQAQQIADRAAKVRRYDVKTG